MMRATMSPAYLSEFRPYHTFPASIIAKADAELDNFAQVMTERFGIKVYRPRLVNWDQANGGRGGYTGAMPRDGLMVVGRMVVEACFAWGCRRGEVESAWGGFLEDLINEEEEEEGIMEGDGKEEGLRICRAPRIIGHDTIYDGLLDHGATSTSTTTPIPSPQPQKWAITNTRPAFDCADFLRFGHTLIGQLSNVTNQKGVDYLRAVLPSPYTVELLNTTDDHAMHIDATILPLRQGLLVYCPLRVTEEELRRHEVFGGWELRALPWNPEVEDEEDPEEEGEEKEEGEDEEEGEEDEDEDKEEEEEDDDDPPMYMCSKWLVLNALSIDEKTIVVEAKQKRFAKWLESEFGMEVVRLPFRHVNSLGGSFHCATVDLVRGKF